jgi:hypothetical protein
MSPTIWPARRKTLWLKQLDAVVVDRGARRRGRFPDEAGSGPECPALA